MVDPHFAANQTAIAILLHKIDAIRAENEKLRGIIEDDAKLILRVRMENEKLRVALKPFAKCIETYPDAKDDYEIGFGGVHDADCKVFIRDFRAAAAALKETGDE